MAANAIVIKSRRNNKRSSSPGTAAQTPKRKKDKNTSPTNPTTVISVLETVDPNVTGIHSNASSPASQEPTEKIPIFKNVTYVHSHQNNQASSKKSRMWKNLKQIIAAERLLPWKPDDPTYGSIAAPPSFKPAKKYSDLSGLPANYTDPQTKIRYCSTEEFSRIRMLPMDIVAGYLALRKANAPVP